jgi:starch synthase
VGGETEEVTFSGLRDLVPEPFRHRLIFHGRVPHSDLAGLYRDAAVCVVPSRWDNSPYTVYEAMGCGTPVVGADVGGIGELVDHGKTGLLVPRDNPERLAAAVVSLLTDHRRRDAMSHIAQRRAVALFHPERVAEQTIELYRNALGRRSVRSMGGEARRGA